MGSLGGCFNRNLLAAIHTRDASVSNITIFLQGILEGTPARFAVIFDYRRLVEKLLRITEHSCIVANTLKDVVVLTISLQQNPKLV